MESELGNVSNKQVKKNPEVKHEDDKPLLEANSPHFPSPPSISSSSSSSSLDSETIEKIHLEDLSTKSEIDGNLLPGPEFISSPDITAPTTPQWSMVSASPTPSGFMLNSPMKSPSAQTMGRPTGYDPNRIPTSIFSTKASNPTEWSTTSNESLFSIHMGNNSFSREHSIWLEEWNNAHGTEPKPNELSSLPPVMEESSVKSGKVLRLEKEEELDKSSKVAAGPSTQNHSKEKIATVELVKGTTSDESTNRTSSSTTHTSFSNPRLSGESGTSGSSFAFPVLVSDAKNGSSKVTVVTEKPEKQQAQAQVLPEATPPNNASDQKGWFSCFSCWPRCC